MLEPAVAYSDKPQLGLDAHAPDGKGDCSNLIAGNEQLAAMVRSPSIAHCAANAHAGIIGRWLRPRGICVAILGPDGCGKSSVIEQFVPRLEPAFSGTQYFHLRPSLLRSSANGQGPQTDPQGQTPRGFLSSTAKLLYIWADYVLGYYTLVRPLLVRSKLVVFDRYYHDLLIDTRRFRYAGPQWLTRLVAAMIPLPDLILVLDAPGEVLQARKQEVAPEESARQAAAYCAIVNTVSLRGRAVLIDATCPLDRVVSECVVKTLALVKNRTGKQPSLDPKHLI